jgi:hypothetical protein
MKLVRIQVLVCWNYRRLVLSNKCSYVVINASEGDDKMKHGHLSGNCNVISSHYWHDSWLIVLKLHALACLT